MVDAEMPGTHVWGRLEGLPKFVIIECPEIVSRSEVLAREVWRDSFDYEILDTRPAQGEYDVRVFEKNPGASGQNAISGAKATKINGFLTRWGCENISIGTSDITFTFNLWNAVRSPEFWSVSAMQLANMSFDLVSYANGVGTINVTTLTQTEPKAIADMDRMVQRRVEGRGGTVTVFAHPVYTFTIERNEILTRFRQAVKQSAERIYMYQRYRFSKSIMDAAEAAGGSLTLTKSELLAALVDKMAE
jgi:hypothetical protein